MSVEKPSGIAKREKEDGRDRKREHCRITITELAVESDNSIPKSIDVAEPSIVTKNPLATEFEPSKPFYKSTLFVGGIQVVIITCYGYYIYSQYKKTAAFSRTLSIPDEVADRYNRTASNFDDDVGTTEWITGIGSKRRKMMEQARGHLLEVSVGTGRNIEYYPWKSIKSVTMVDYSEPMMLKAQEKFEDSNPAAFRKARFLIQDASSALTAPPGGYDTIVQTFGLCSTSKPIELLQNLGRLCTSQGGKILLLEHGRGHYAWVNRILDDLGAANADRHGCWWNKDIGDLVERSGLEIVKMKRYQFGTLWWIELKPKEKKTALGP
ncbi:MAG: hypothetical protein M1814_005232 [Vezdaea aestivalis]|nr:MAG: hypothetical protein M1814_005232 [Vezdaea aestivalis]